jgi:hypothetical protein
MLIENLTVVGVGEECILLHMVGYHFCLINLAILLMRIYGIIYEGWK